MQKIAPCVSYQMSFLMPLCMNSILLFQLLEVELISTILYISMICNSVLYLALYLCVKS